MLRSDFKTWWYPCSSKAMFPNTETQWQTCRVTLEHSVQNGMSPSNFSPQSSRNPMKEEIERVRDRGDTIKKKTPRTSEPLWTRLICTHRDWGSMHIAPVCTRPSELIACLPFSVLWDSWVWEQMGLCFLTLLLDSLWSRASHSNFQASISSKIGDDYVHYSSWSCVKGLQIVQRNASQMIAII